MRVWQEMGMDRSSADVRADMLSALARDMEFSVWQFSTTEDGYKERSESKIRAVRRFEQPRTWEELDWVQHKDSKEVVDGLRRICAARKGKGKVK